MSKSLIAPAECSKHSDDCTPDQILWCGTPEPTQYNFNPNWLTSLVPPRTDQMSPPSHSIFSGLSTTCGSDQQQ